MVDSLSSGNGAESLRSKQLELTRQSTGQVRSAEKKPGDLQRVPFKHAAEYSTLHVCEETTRGLGRSYTQGLEEAGLVLTQS